MATIEAFCLNLFDLSRFEQNFSATGSKLSISLEAAAAEIFGSKG